MEKDDAFKIEGIGLAVRADIPILNYIRFRLQVFIQIEKPAEYLDGVFV
jgi:hypothetical protein